MRMAMKLRSTGRCFVRFIASPCRQDLDVHAGDGRRDLHLISAATLLNGNFDTVGAGGGADLGQRYRHRFGLQVVPCASHRVYHDTDQAGEQCVQYDVSATDMLRDGNPWRIRSLPWRTRVCIPYFGRAPARWAWCRSGRPVRRLTQRWAWSARGCSGCFLG